MHGSGDGWINGCSRKKKRGVFRPSTPTEARSCALKEESLENVAMHFEGKKEEEKVGGNPSQGTDVGSFLFCLSFHRNEAASTAFLSPHNPNIPRKLF